MTTIRSLERMMLSRSSMADKSLGNDTMMSEIIQNIRREIEAEVSDVVDAARTEIADMKKRMRRVELGEIEIRHAQDQVALVQEEANKRVQDADKRTAEIDAMHNAIHEKHNATIKEQAALIAQLQGQINTLKDEVRSECSGRVRAETALESAKEMKSHVQNIVEKVRSANPVAQRPSAPPTVEFDIVRGGDGRISKVVAKPKS